MIGKPALVLALCLIFLRVGVAAQTPVTTTGGTANVVPLFSGNATVGNSDIAQSGDNVGIGTRSPGQTLEVNGTGLFDWKNNSGTIYLGDTNHGIQSTSGSGVSLFTYGIPNGIFLQQVTGYVGVGTSSPGAKLDVEGGSVNIGGLPQHSPVAALGISSTDNHFLSLYSSLGASNWNQIVQAGDQGVIFSGGAMGTGSFVIAPWANGNPGLRITGNGNVGIGTATPGSSLDVNGSVKLSTGSGASITFPDSTVQSTAWNGTTFGGDYAESIDVLGTRANYEPGDVIVIDKEISGKFAKSRESYSTMVAGVFSTKPGLLGRRVGIDRPNQEAEVPMAMMGIVPTKATTENGPIKRGDLLVTSYTPGFAMKGTERDRMMGAVIGKAMSPLAEGQGVIEVLLALQ